jgi:hypothetical protein
MNVRTPYRTTVVMAGLAMQRTRFNPKQIHMRMVVEKVVLGQVLLSSISGFSRHYYSTNATY